MSSGMSSHVSSAGASGVSSIATPSVDDDVVGPDGSGFLLESDGGVGGGGADDILDVGQNKRPTRSLRTRVLNSS